MLTRIIINELDEYPRLKVQGTLATSIEAMEVLLARYSARITGIDITEEL